MKKKTLYYPTFHGQVNLRQQAFELLDLSTHQISCLKENIGKSKPTGHNMPLQSDKIKYVVFTSFN